MLILKKKLRCSATASRIAMVREKPLQGHCDYCEWQGYSENCPCIAMHLQLNSATHQWGKGHGYECSLWSISRYRSPEKVNLQTERYRYGFWHRPIAATLLTKFDVTPSVSLIRKEQFKHFAERLSLSTSASYSVNPKRTRVGGLRLRSTVAFEPVEGTGFVDVRIQRRCIAMAYEEEFTDHDYLSTSRFFSYSI